MFKKFDFALFIAFLLILLTLAFLSLLAAYEKDEETIGDNAIWNLMSYFIYVLSFPYNLIPAKIMNGAFFFYGLVINSFFYGYLLERLVYRLTDYKKDQIKR